MADNERLVNVPAPEPVEKVNDLDTSDVEITPDTILGEILSTDKYGHAECMVTLSLERINQIVPGKHFLDYTDEEKEYVDNCEIHDCSIDINSLDGLLFNAIFTFDTKESQYLKDMNEMFNRYKHVMEEYAASDEQNKAIVLSIIIAPDRFKGKGICFMNMPIMGIRCLDDNGENASMYMMFHAEDVDFVTIEMTEDEEIQLTADAMRLAAEGGDGNLF